MFDANMRHVPKGTMFFIKIESIKPECTLSKMGVNKGDILKCEMLSDCSDNPTVTFYFNGKAVTQSHRDHWRLYWAVYAGSIDGTGFISEEDKNKAVKLL